MAAVHPTMSPYKNTVRTQAPAFNILQVSLLMLVKAEVITVVDRVRALNALLTGAQAGPVLVVWVFFKNFHAGCSGGHGLSVLSKASLYDQVVLAFFKNTRKSWTTESDSSFIRS